MTSPGTLGATIATAAALLLPATAGAVSVTVTGDTGQPVALAQDVATTIRQMAPVIAPTFAPAEKRFSLQILDPAGKEGALSVRCGNTADTDPTRAVTYTGNGTYTLRFTTYGEDDFFCEQAGTVQTFMFTVNASTRLTAPAATLLYRRSGRGFKDPVFTYELNPGADAYRIFYAFDAKLGPNGGIVGEYGRDAYMEISGGSPPTGSTPIGFRRAGVVTLVAIATAGDGQTPFSAPLVLTVVSPFDFADTPSLKDAKGPSYAIGGKVSEPLAAGASITMSLAKGKGRFKKVATSKIRAGGAFRFTFKQKGKGSFRVRYDFKGAKFMTRGVYTQKFAIKTRVVSLTSLKHVSGD